MTYTCLVVDDEDLARELVLSHLAQLPEFEVVGACASALEARSVLRERNVDLLLLDIEMPVLRGTDFLKSLPSPPAVIFTTAYRNYAVDGFALDAVDYLLKPITFERFFQATERFLQRRLPRGTSASETVDVSSRAGHIFVRKERRQVRVQLADILYLESQRDYVLIHLIDGTSHSVKYRLHGLLGQLDDRFLQIHRSFVVNRDHVTAFTRQDVELGSRELPIGERYRDVVSCGLSS